MGAAQTAVLPRGAVLEEIVAFLDAERRERKRLGTTEESGVFDRSLPAIALVQWMQAGYQRQTVHVRGVDFVSGSAQALLQDRRIREQCILAVAIADLTGAYQDDVMSAVARILEAFELSLGRFQPPGRLVLPVLSPQNLGYGTTKLTEMLIGWITALTSYTAQ